MKDHCGSGWHRLCGVVLLSIGLGPLSLQAQGTAQLQTLLKAKDLPQPLQSLHPDPTSSAIAGVPTGSFGLQLCSTGAQGLQVSVPGPPTMDMVLLALAAPDPQVLRSVISAKIYRFESPTDAQRAWSRLTTAIRRCQGTIRSGEALISTLSQGDAPQPWVLNQQRNAVHGSPGAGNDAAANYSVFSLHGPVVLTTSLSRLSAAPISPSEQQAVQQLSERVGHRLDASAQR